jgi:glyoxylase-like metal-dependent hydrolase (beta-lactamase superfamily II)
MVGDHLSPAEIPMLGDAPGSLATYLETLARLEPLVERSEFVVPGHGDPMDAERALAVLREDRAYLEALARDGGGAALPLARRTPTQRGIHQRNVARATR